MHPRPRRKDEYHVDRTADSGRVLRINEVPQIDVHLIKSGEAPGGIGEAGTSVAPPALGNALFAATGVRLRRLPIDRDVLLGKKPG